ncbi:Pancreatic lipase-related protein 2 [Folsomia candida]|uniref:Pancreatic lipase-related protein 2 n=1 Tax=Folsomia candida TaxID=158441 RepID=A0A226DYW5_FOLCA|nr:Pancreatic lipase-related protein 2 [Folsomia candida]
MVSRLILSVLVTTTIVARVQGDLAGLHFYLYTKGNTNAVEIKASDANTINNSAFVVGQPVKFLCHGYTSSYTAEFPRDLKNSEKFGNILIQFLLHTKENCGISSSLLEPSEPLKLQCYRGRLGGTILAGGRLRRSLCKHSPRRERNCKLDEDVDRHSLGGQVGAFITPNLDNGDKIPRVTGLDPARPGFEQATTSPSERLDPTDADFVDVIRTSTGAGSTSTTADPPGAGTVDFYPNGGVKQPGFTTTVGFKAYKCTSYADFQGSCPKTNGVLMGEYVPKTISGTYYLSTKSFAPFAKR